MKKWTNFPLILGLLGALPLSGGPASPAPWALDESGVTEAIHVNGATADGPGTGTWERPFKTLKVALERVGERLKRTGVRLVLAPGTYRENFFLEGINGPFPLIIEGRGAVISGSDLFSNWTADGDLWTTPWPHRFDFTANPYGSFVKGKTPGFRSEMLFMDGRALDQVLSRESLVPGTYWVDEAGARLLLSPPAGMDPRTARVEVSVRGAANLPAIFIIRNASRVRVSGLTVTHCANPLRAAANIHGCSEVVVEDCHFDLNNGQGFQVGTLGPLFKEGSRFPSNIVVRRVSCNSNGVVGFGGSFSNALWEEVTAHGNNWRGLRWGVAGWFTCGFKFLVIGRVQLNGLSTHGNYAHGAWFDTAIEDTAVSNLASFGNRRMGIVVEGTRGPLVFTGGTSAGNGEGGLQGFDSSGVTVRGMTLVGNEGPQILMAGSLPFTENELQVAGKDPFRFDRLSRAQIPHDWRWCDLTVGSLKPGIKGLIDGYVRQEKAPKTGIWAPFFETLTGEGNVFYHPDGPGAPVTLADDLTPLTFHDFRLKNPKLGDLAWSEERIRAAWLKIAPAVERVRVARPGEGQALGL